MGRRTFGIGVAMVVACALAAPAGAARARHLTRAHALELSWPADGTVTTPFTPHHHGLDIGMLRSLDVRAAVAGRVVSVGEVSGFEGYGNIVLVQVTPDVVTLYAHLTSYKVHAGQEIRRGELLGVAGCTGLCTGTHLHFEVRQNGVAVDPRKFLDG